MPIYTVRQGLRSRATTSLSWFEQIASNEMIAQQLRDAGFTKVSAMGDGLTNIEAEQAPS